MSDVWELIKAGAFTLEVAVLSWCLATVLGMVFALIGRVRFLPLQAVWSLWITCLRGIPQLVLMYVLFFGIGQLGLNISPITAAVLALGVTEAAFTSEVFRSSFMTVHQGAREAGVSLGLSSPKVFRLIEAPILVRFALPPLLNSFVGLLKLATLSSAIGVQEIIFRGEQQIQQHFEVVNVSVTIILVYVIFTIPITRLTARLEARLRGPAVT